MRSPAKTDAAQTDPVLRGPVFIGVRSVESHPPVGARPSARRVGRAWRVPELGSRRNKAMFWLLIFLLLACALCSWLRPDSGLAQSAARAFDSTVGLLSQHSTDGHYDEELRPPPRPPPPRQRVPSLRAAPTAARRRRCTPFQAKRIAAAQGWRCACGCVDPSDPQGRGYLLDESFEIDHVRPLSAGGSNDESNLQALLRTHHQAKSSAFARSR